MLKRTVKKGLKLGLSLASFAQKEVKKNTGTFVKAGKIGSKAAKKILYKVAAEAKKDAMKLEVLLLAELKKEAKKAKPFVKSKIKKLKKKVVKRMKKKGKK